MRFRRSSTLIRWKTEAFENAFQGGDFRKRMPFVLVWTGENEGFRKRCVMNSIISLPRRTKTYRFLIASVDGRKRFENASVGVDIGIRFRWIKNGGTRKRISVDVALDDASKFRFRAHIFGLAYADSVSICILKFLLKLNHHDWIIILKYRSVTDIVRPIREILRRGEETVGHFVRPKWIEVNTWVCPTRVYWCPTKL